MIDLLFTLQSTVTEALPVDPAWAADRTAAAANAAHEGINYLQLMLRASLPVQVIVGLLLLGSVVSWVIIFRKVRSFKQADHNADDFESRFWSGTDLGKLFQGITGHGKIIEGLEAIFEAGFQEFTRSRDKKQLGGQAQLESAQRAMRVAYMREMGRLENRLELLANIGSTAPYVGLVGTVFGIMVTMHDMVNQGQQSGIASVAPGISEALIATAVGLFVAVPAVWAYNRFTARVERLATRYESFADEFSSILQRQIAVEH